MGLKHHWSIESIADKLLKTEICDFQIPLAGKLHLALIFPGSYQTGMSNLGFLTIHRIACQTPDVAVERFFFPLQPDLRHEPPFYSLETRRPLGDFDILAFSISYEGDFELLPHIIKPLGIPLLREKRKKGRFPLLMAGGAAVTANSKALSLMFDILVHGEGEMVFENMLKTFLSDGYNKERISEMPGVWIPEIRKTPTPVSAHHDVENFPAWSHCISSQNVFNGAPLIEVMRGCKRICKFCMAREIYAPLRVLSASKFSEFIEKWSNHKQIGLIAPSLFDHPEIEKILEILSEKKFSIHNSSVKWETLNEKILKLLLNLGVKSITLAPESGSEFLRNLMGKPLSELRFFDTLKLIGLLSFEGVKMYFIVGLPAETDDHLKETVEFIIKARQVIPEGVSLSASFSGFVPKPHTEWEHEVPIQTSELKKRFAFIRTELNRAAPEIRLKFDSPEETARQIFFTRAGPELAHYFEEESMKCRPQLKKIVSGLMQSDY
ncbi:MAG: radical SAM protein [Candidatus Riflebacteria bacterium]|nr:radical SAM protein [Candidatus Riflebacteria bacterium]